MEHCTSQAFWKNRGCPPEPRRPCFGIQVPWPEAASCPALPSLQAGCHPLKRSELRDQTNLRVKSGGEPLLRPGRQRFGTSSSHASHSQTVPLGYFSGTLLVRATIQDLFWRSIQQRPIAGELNKLHATLPGPAEGAGNHVHT